MSILPLLPLLSVLLPPAQAAPWMGGPRGEGGAFLAPDPRAASGPDRSFDLEALFLDLALLPAERAVEGSARLRLRRLGPGPVVLHQVGLEIREVRGVAGPIPFHTHEEQFVVEVPEAFGQALAEELTVSYRAEPDTGLHFRGAAEGGRDRGQPDAWAEVWSQGEGEDNRHWFPSWDHPSDRFVYEGHFTVPDGWKVLTNSGQDLVNYLVMVAAGPYEVHAHPQAPQVEVWVPPGTDPRAISRVLDPVPGMMAHLGQRTGVPYPWGPYRQVFVQRFLYTGMENTSATVQHERMLLDARWDGSAEWVDSVVAHELAHQWYGDLLTCDGWRELWLNEGFATFMAADWQRSQDGEVAHAARVRGWMGSARAQRRPLAGRFFQGEGAAPNHDVYNKGAAVLHMLQVLLGPERFWQGIARYTQAHQRGLVDTADLQREMEAVSGQQLDWFFQQWVELGHIPALRVARRYEAGALHVTVHQVLDEEHPRYTLPVTIEVGTADGQVLRRSGWLDDAELELVIELPEAPRWVAFDPDGGLLAELEDPQDPPAWVAQLASPSGHARLAAIAALAQTDQPEALAALLADGQADLALRTAAAGALGEQRAMTALLAALEDPQVRVREAVATALGSSPDDGPVPALRRRVGADPSLAVRTAALRALARLDGPAAATLARDLLRLRDREERPLRDAAFEILGEHGLVADLPALLDPRAPDRARNAGLSAAARISSRQEGDQRKRLEARIARAAEPLLQDLDLRTRQHVLGLLGQVGDESTVARLEQFRRAQDIPEVQEAARDAIRAIRGRGTPAAPGGNEAEARIRELEERLDALETALEKAGERH